MTFPEKGQAIPLLRVEGLKTYYPIRQGVFSRVVDYVKAVDGVSFSIREETLGLVGESRRGKSSVGRSVLQLEPPHEGRIYYDGRELSELGNREWRRMRASMQMIFQDPYSSLNPRMRARDIVAEPLLAHQMETQSTVWDKVDWPLTL